MSELPKTLRVKCECGRSMRVPFFEHATDVRRRTCRGCGARWTVKTEPVSTRVPGMIVHVATLTKIGEV
jgi:hypothetical protein